MSDSKVTKKKTSILKHVYYKVLRKSTKCYEENDLQTDAVPDMPSKQQPERNAYLNSEFKSRIRNEDTPDTDLNDRYKFSEQFYYSSRNNAGKDSISLKSNSSEEKTDPDFNYIPKKPDDSKPPFSMNRTSVIVNGGVGIQFGNNITNNNTVNYVWNGVNKRQKAQEKQNFSYEKTVEIQELLKKEIELEVKHLDFLSGFIGKNWKEIGQALRFTSGEIDAVEEKGGTYKDKAFEMLKRWCQKKGDEATVGKLSSKMWKSRIQSAIEAVQQLSININRMM